jgi:hypothetical protein
MLNKENLLCKVEDELMKIGSAKLNSIKYDTESKCGLFKVFLLKTFERVLSNKYNFCNVSLKEEIILETINKNINVN